MITKQKNLKHYVYAETEDTICSAKKLVIEYANSLGCSPCLENIEKELATFPHPFAPPDGKLLLALYNDQPVGVLGIRKISKNSCEMARLYVKPYFQNKGIGRDLAQKGITVGTMLGSRTIRLYTLPTMAKALALYRDLGFKEISPYTEHPIKGAFYLQYDG